MLEEVAAKGITGRFERFVACADPATALDESVFAIKGRGGEVVVERVDVKAVEAIDGGAGPLPDVAYQIEEVTLWTGIYRTGGGKAGQIDIAGRIDPVRLIPRQLIAQQGPLPLARQLDGQSAPGRFPATEGGGFQLIDLGGPIPGHGHPLRHQPQLQLLGLGGIADPEGGHTCFGILAPAPTFLIPPLLLVITPCLHEREILGIADQHAAGLEGGDF